MSKDLKQKQPWYDRCMPGACEGHQGRQANILMAIWLKKTVCINCLRLVIKSPFRYWDIIKQKIGLTEAKIVKKRDAEGLISKLVAMRDIACDEKTLLRQPSIWAKQWRTSFHQNKLSLVRLLCDIDFVESCFYTQYSFAKLINMISTLVVMRHWVRWDNLPSYFFKTKVFTQYIK